MESSGPLHSNRWWLSDPKSPVFFLTAHPRGQAVRRRHHAARRKPLLGNRREAAHSSSSALGIPITRPLCRQTPNGAAALSKMFQPLYPAAGTRGRWWRRQGNALCPSGWHSSNYRVSMKSPTLNGLKLDSIKNRRQQCLRLLIFAKTSERERKGGGLWRRLGCSCWW